MDDANKRVDARTRAALTPGGSPLSDASTTLVLGSDRRPDGGPGRSDSIMLVRVDPGRNTHRPALDPARPARDDPRATATTASTRPTRSAARRSRSRPCRTLTGIPINHVVAGRLRRLPRARRRARRRHDRQPDEDHLEQLRRPPVALRARHACISTAATRWPTRACARTPPTRPTTTSRAACASSACCRRSPAASPRPARCLHLPQRRPHDRQAAHDRPLGRRPAGARLAAAAREQHAALPPGRHHDVGRRRQRADRRRREPPRHPGRARASPPRSRPRPATRSPPAAPRRVARLASADADAVGLLGRRALAARALGVRALGLGALGVRALGLRLRARVADRPRTPPRSPSSRTPTSRPSRSLVAVGALAALAVVGRVEALALEVHRGRVQHALHRLAADLALGQRVVGEPLHDVEAVPVRAQVLVDRHCDRSISRASPRHWHSRVESAKRGAAGYAGPRPGMRIAIVTDYYYPMLGGITEHVHGQARELARRGHEVTVVTGPPAAHAADRRPGRPAGRRRGLRGRAHRRRRAALRQRLADDPHRAGRPRAAAATALQAARRRRRAPARALQPEHVRDRARSAHPRQRRRRRAPTTRSSRRACCSTCSRRSCGAGSARLDAHVVVSEACIGSLAPYFPFDYRIIPNGIDDRHFSPDAEPLPELREGGKPLILFLGRFDPRNGLADDARGVRAGACRARGRRCGCASSATGRCGNVYRRKLPERVAGDVIWAGRVDWSRPRYYASADIHCTPCQRASFGMVLLEAMSSGRPVVASRISGFQLLMEHGKQGLMVEPGRRRRPLRPGAALPARPAGRARAHGPRGPHDGRHALRLVERRGAARGALRRAAARASGRTR